MKCVQNNLKHDVCPVCLGTLIFKVGEIEYTTPTYYSTTIVKLQNTPELWKCKSCDSGFVQNSLIEQDSLELYSQGSSEYRWSHSKSFEQEKPKIVSSVLKKILRPGSRVVDVGCGSGSFLDLAKASGCETFGVEYSLESLSIIRENGHIADTSIEAFDGNFDTIVAFDLIEHLYEVPEFMNDCFHRLNPGGHLILLTGAISSLPAKITKNSWWYVQFPEHIVFPSVKYFGEHSNFKLISVTPTWANSSFESRSFMSVLKGIVKESLSLSFTGMNTFHSDHVLVVLCRE
jgi:2-polyprenyl-3-methyl-5-hydroxy-6-metoxy-1,4-benzoquinol methylase